MEAFNTLTAPAAPLARDNVDTEVIIPIGRLIAFGRGQLGPYCFEPWRYDAPGQPRGDFPLNDPRYRGARILVTGANFGCGSSREAAVWALWDMGFRCIIAESFGDIFRMNCFQNGLLPITLEKNSIASLLQNISAIPAALTVDLERLCIIHDGRAGVIPFQIPAERRLALLEGLDEIGMTLKQLSEIRAFEIRDTSARPWVYRLES